jgi:hypothetical protein
MLFMRLWQMFDNKITAIQVEERDEEEKELGLSLVQSEDA